MNVNVVSDLHLEMADLTLPGGDILLICGDVAEARNIKPSLYTGEKPQMLKWELPERRPDRHYRFFKEECSKYNHVLYVTGNHEFYGSKFHQVNDHLAEVLSDCNVKILERDFVNIDNVIFIGTTLWTDTSDPIVENVVRNSMNDYRYITYKEFYGHNPTQVNYRKLRPMDTTREFFKSRDYIFKVAEENADKSIVVITHHGPSRLSIDPSFNTETNKELNRAYYSDLDQLILNHQNIRVMCHGHTHSLHNYKIGETHILCNPRGYYGYERIANKYTQKSFSIDSSGKVEIDESWHKE